MGWVFITCALLILSCCWWGGSNASNCTRATTCSNSGECLSDGTCQCYSGIGGSIPDPPQYCFVCLSAGPYPLYVPACTNCSVASQCYGACSNTSAACICQPGFSGPRCNVTVSIVTLAPTPAPTPSPTNLPTEAPIPVPTTTPSPTEVPTDIPTNTPSPTDSPTNIPTYAPTSTPFPSDIPSAKPTLDPTDIPTNAPTPTQVPPTDFPTNSPTPTPPAATDLPLTTPSPSAPPFSCSSCDPRVSCNRKQCGLCPLGTIETGNTCRVLCGDGICNLTIGENCVSCPLDCTESSCNVCGDSTCNPGEDCHSCFEDCGPCESTCNLACIHGTCYSNECQCTSTEWTGPLCDTSSVQPITGISYNNSNPSTTVNVSSLVQYNLQVTSLVEVDSNGIKRQPPINLSTLTFAISQSNSSNVATTNYSASLPNGANLLISLLLFLQPTNISFAGTSMTYASNTLKLTIRIKDWPFAALANSLVVVIIVTSFSPSLFGKCGNASEDGNDDRGSLRWFTIQSGPYTLYGQMLNVGVLDGRNRALTFSRNSTTNEIQVRMPHFWSYADLDPNFSVLLDGSDSSTTTCNRELLGSSDNHKPFYPIVIGVVVGFFVVLALVLIFVRHKFVLWKQKRHYKESLALDQRRLSIEKRGDMEVTSATGHFVLQL